MPISPKTLSFRIDQTLQKAKREKHKAEMKEAAAQMQRAVEKRQQYQKWVDNDADRILQAGMRCAHNPLLIDSGWVTIKRPALSRDRDIVYTSDVIRALNQRGFEVKCGPSSWFIRPVLKETQQ
jgi:hypothetical protein